MKKVTRTEESSTVHKFTISLPVQLNELMDRDRAIPGMKGLQERSPWIAEAIEFYLAAKDALPRDYVLSAPAERVREAMKKTKVAKKSGRAVR